MTLDFYITLVLKFAMKLAEAQFPEGLGHCVAAP